MQQEKVNKFFLQINDSTCNINKKMQSINTPLTQNDLKAMLKVNKLQQVKTNLKIEYAFIF
jgi:hypothetical protein